MLLEDYDPIPMLVTKTTYVKRARFPVIDVHNHLDDEMGGGWIHRPVQEIIRAMDEVNVQTLVDLDGGWSEKTLQRHLDILKPHYHERFQVFGGINWESWKSMGERFPDWAARRMHEQAKWGATGLKIWKNLGMSVRDQNDQLVSIDDPRLYPIWETASELKWPVVIHAADPAAYFEPIDHRNERWEELSNFPDRQIPTPPYPPMKKILDGFAKMISRNPDTTFIGAHVGCYAENLAWVGKLLDKCPNFYIDISNRIGELGRQPYTSRKFFMRYSDRILFGLDSGVDSAKYQTAFRFLETDDEYFNPSNDHQVEYGRWSIYGIGLSDEILKKVYSENARQILNF